MNIIKRTLFKATIVFILIAPLLLTSCYPFTTIDNTTPLNVTIDGVTLEDSRIPTLSKPYYIGIAEGDITGHYAFNKLAYNSTVGTTEEDIWFGSNTYVFPTVAQQMELVSTSIEDDPVKADLSVGTGVHRVYVYYLDNTYAARVEEVILNGTGVVTTVANNILRVNDIRASVVGTGYKAAGTISLRNIADTPVYRYIAVGYTRGRCSIYTVPLGISLYVTDWYVGVSGLNAANMSRITLRANWNDLGATGIVGTQLTAGLFFMPHAEVLIPNGSIIRQFAIPIRFPAKTDVKVSGYVDAGAAIVETSYRGWIEYD